MKLSENSAQAVLRKIRVSPRKINLVAQQIRGLSVEKAINVLTFSRKRIALDVRKTLISAIANAENNHGLDIDSLVVDQAHIGQSFVLKRFQAKAKGRGVSIRKPFSHLTIVVREQGV